MRSAKDVIALATAFEASRMLHAGLELGLFRLGLRPRTAAAIARAARAHPRGVEILCDALVSLGLMVKRGGRYWSAAIAQHHLVAGAAGDLTGLVLFAGSGWDAWGRLAEAVRRGRPLRGAGMSPYWPRVLEWFMLAMRDLAQVRGDARIVARVWDLRRARRLLDVGGGPATYALHLLAAHPRLRAVVFDLPATLRVTRRLLQGHPLRGRIRLHEGDFLRDPLPCGFDAALVSNILHGLDERGCRALLGRVARALLPGGRLLIKDHVLAADRTRPANGARFAVTMLLFTGGRCYTYGEIASWLREVGFRGIRLSRPRGLAVELVEARRSP